MSDPSTTFENQHSAKPLTAHSGGHGQPGRSPYSRRVLMDLVAATDILLLIIVGLLTNYLYVNVYLNSPEPLSKFIWPIAGGCLSFYFIMKNMAMYNADSLLDIPRKPTTLLLCMLFAFGLVFTVLFLTKTASDYSRIWVVYWFGAFYVSLLTSRLIWKNYISYLASSGVFQRRVAIVGAGHMLERVCDAFLEENEHARLVQVIDVGDEIGKDSDSAAIMKSSTNIDTLVQHGQQDKFDQIIVAFPASLSNLIEETVRQLRLLPVDINVAPDFGHTDIPLGRVETVGTMNVINIETKPISDWGVFMKAVIDYAVGAVALFLALPVMCLIAIAIKLDTRGPVFYRQERHGYNHRVIEVMKFRTMTVLENNHDHIQQATKDDDRITEVGRFLRRTSLDELPQLINVLRGQMSLVGPRPHAIAHNTYYGQLLENYANRHRVKPGITGWAQVNGFRGETKDAALMEQRVQYDLDYINKWSIWFDLKILLMTPIYGLVNKNAY